MPTGKQFTIGGLMIVIIAVGLLLGAAVFLAKQEGELLRRSATALIIGIPSFFVPFAVVVWLRDWFCNQPD